MLDKILLIDLIQNLAIIFLGTPIFLTICAICMRNENREKAEEHTKAL